MYKRYEKQKEIRVLFTCECGENLESTFYDDQNVPDEDLDDDGHDEVYCNCGSFYSVPRPSEPYVMGTVSLD
ncbi:hypothetical protein [Paenibacillus odorifer]|uniref:hypothetical protein n=1 Tax=Paenibacillus odorifer TaxID=189426 RepID=UPI00117F9201|nr:hypothetical protein [Paenibacillus odorifer]